ncbi:LemA family protein [Williamsoniiplasma lucivorax]|uniref:LemA family protein n=1 Tax=Williamsoniiplasma lucivorax TaxID=209274 RepID=A0A2S5RE02_9MOLU|nr:LemA family protein [Williamsoniiplasma lucivorax]PPE05534.1 LemA family protein [Williamsoniiplasma lucivorax]
MANKLDEKDTNPSNINNEGRDVHVIDKTLKIEIGKESKYFEIFLWVLLIIPGLIFLMMKVSAKNYFNKLEQTIQTAASEIDNYLEQRVIVLENAATLVKKSVDLDKDVMKSIAKYRSGIKDNNGDDLSQIASDVENIATKLNIAIENYPDLKAHNVIADAMQKNDYLQREITAARTNYNDYVNRWNNDIQVWPTKKIVAAKQGYTTRIPFIASAEIKQKAKQNFFE